MPETYDLPIWRGNNPSVIFRFKNSDGSLFDLSGFRLLLTVYRNGRRLLKKDTSTDGAAFSINIPAATLTWTPTLVETRGLPLGSVAHYEVERWKDGVQVTDLTGHLVVSGGNNVDA